MSAPHRPLDCESTRELLAVAAVEGPLAAHDPALDAHLADCADCAALRADYEAVVGLLAFALPDAEPAPHVRDRLRLRLRAARRPARRRWFVPAAVAAAIALSLALGAVVGAWLAASTGDDPLELAFGGRRHVLEPAEAGHGSQGEVLIDRATGAAVLLARDLPPLGPDEVYQLWFLRTDGTRVNAYTFVPGPGGDALHTVPLPPDFDSVRGVWVTREPGGGGDEPRGPAILITWWK